MRILLRVVCLGTVVVLTAPAARSQPPFGGPFANPAMLLGQESVRKELKLSADQSKKLDELSKKMREKFQEAFQAPEEERGKKFQELTKESQKAVAGILTPEQLKRLKQISYQRQGISAVADPEVAKALQLTDDQKKQVQKINRDTFAQLRKLFQGGPPDQEGRKKIGELRQTAAEKIMKLLTGKQKAKWKELQGKPFKGEIRFGPPGGGRG